jgi:hypothetical protein
VCLFYLSWPYSSSMCHTSSGRANTALIKRLTLLERQSLVSLHMVETFLAGKNLSTADFSTVMTRGAAMRASRCACRDLKNPLKKSQNGATVRKLLRIAFCTFFPLTTQPGRPLFFSREKIPHEISSERRMQIAYGFRRFLPRMHRPHTASS